MFPSFFRTTFISAIQTATWDGANTTTAPASWAPVDFNVYSGDSFASSTAMLAQGVPNCGSPVVNMPNMRATSAHVRARGSDNILFAMSPGDFTVNGPYLTFADGVD